MNDTSSKVQRVLIEGYRKMTPQHKLRQVNELTKSIQQLALVRIKQQYGDISEQEQKLRLASLWLSREMMFKAFHWDPQKEGY